MTPLPTKTNQNDLTGVQAILQSGEFTQGDLDQALARAVLAFDQRHEIARLLLAHGANPNGQYGGNYGPIILVTCECLYPDGLAFLIQNGADVSFAPIQTKYGATSPLSAALGTYARGNNQRRHQVIDLLIQHGAILPEQITPAVLAIHRGDVATLARAVDRDPELVAQTHRLLPYGNMHLAGATLLHQAVEFGEIECIDLLLQRGADINARADIIDGIGGQSPVFHAIDTCAEGNFRTLEHLCKQRTYRIDPTIRATWRRYGQVQPIPMTALAFSESTARQDQPGRTRAALERALLYAIDPL